MRASLYSRKYSQPDGKEGNVEEYLRSLINYIKTKEPDITYRLHRTEKPTTTLMFYELYPSQEAFENHRKNVAAFRDEHGKLPDEFLVKPTEIERYSIVVK
jgi:quinol monooxygenase YgiN